MEVLETHNPAVLYARWFKLSNEPAFFETQEAFMQLFAEHSFTALVDDVRPCTDVDPVIIETLQDVIAPMMRAVGLSYTAILINPEQQFQTNTEDFQANISVNVLVQYFTDAHAAEAWLLELLSS